MHWIVQSDKGLAIFAFEMDGGVNWATCAFVTKYAEGLKDWQKHKHVF